MEISHPDKLLFPDLGWTKRDLIEFYLELAETLLPHLKERPVVLQRFPEGIGGSGFYQQEIPEHYPDWIEGIEVERRQKGRQRMLELHTKTALKYVVNQDAVSFHTWLSRKKSLNKPDCLVYDLDPPGEEFSKVKEVAKELKADLEERGATPFVMTTGSSGLHVLVPIRPEQSFEEAREAAKKIAEALVEKRGELATLEQRKSKRGGRVFLDYLRNSYGQTTVSPYSVRAKKGAPVATPLHWDELDGKEIGSQSFHVKNLFKRLARIDDPWKGLFKSSCSLARLL